MDYRDRLIWSIETVGVKSRFLKNSIFIALLVVGSVK